MQMALWRLCTGLPAHARTDNASSELLLSSLLPALGQAGKSNREGPERPDAPSTRHHLLSEVAANVVGGNRSSLCTLLFRPVHPTTRRGCWPCRTSHAPLGGVDGGRDPGLVVHRLVPGLHWRPLCSPVRPPVPSHALVPGTVVLWRRATSVRTWWAGNPAKRLISPAGAATAGIPGAGATWMRHSLGYSSQAGRTQFLVALPSGHPCAGVGVNGQEQQQCSRARELGDGPAAHVILPRRR